MAQQIINIGANPSDGSGDPLRVSFDKINKNFTELYTGNIAAPGGGNITPSVSTTVTSVSGKTGKVRLVVGDVDGAVSQTYIDNRISEVVSDAVNDQIIDLAASAPTVVNDMRAIAHSIQTSDGVYTSIVQQLETLSNAIANTYTKAEVDALLLNIINNTNDWGYITIVDDRGSIDDPVTEIEDYGSID